MLRVSEWESESCESSKSSESERVWVFQVLKHSWFPAFVWHSDIFFGTIVIQKWTKLGEDWGEIWPESVNKYRFQSNKIEYIFVEAIN